MTTTNKFNSHYDNLGISRNAQPEVIRAAYKALAQKYHPDRNPNNPDAHRIMQIINTAYEVLSNPEARAKHDRWIDEQERNHQKEFNESNNNHKDSTDNSSSFNKSANTAHDNKQRHNQKKNSSDTSFHHTTKNNVPTKASFWSPYGRMRRITYILCFTVAMFVLTIGIVVLSNIPSISLTSIFEALFIFFLYIIFVFIPSVFLNLIGIRRLHDFNYQGWWILIPLAPLIIMFIPGSRGENRFGKNPRQKSKSKVIYVEEVDGAFWAVTIVQVFFMMFLGFTTFDSATANFESESENFTYDIKQENQNHPIEKLNINESSSEQVSLLNEKTELEEKPVKPKVNMYIAKERYDNAVANINSVWNSLHPSIQNSLRPEQRAINATRETNCKAQAKGYTNNLDEQKAYRYLCEVPLLNQRAEFLKTQLNTVVSPKPDKKQPTTAQKNINGGNLNSLIHAETKKAVNFLNRDDAEYNGYEHKMDSKDILYADVNNDNIDDAIVGIHYCELVNCHMTTRVFDVVVYTGVGDGNYSYGDARTMGLTGDVTVDNQGIIHVQTKHYSDEDPHCCPSTVLNSKFKLDGESLVEVY